MRIELTHCTALLIDMQERLFPHIHENDQLKQNCVKLINGLKILNVPIIVTQQYTKGLGPTIAPVASAVGEFEPKEKMTFSACGISDVQSVILGSGGHFVVVFGIETHVCIQQTVLDILVQGRVPIVVEDCVSSRKPSDKQTAINRMRAHGAIITSYESLLFELMGTAEAEAFKQISQLVK